MKSFRNLARLQAFTLVELIVVITILAILGTIGFLSLQGYSLSARDSARLSDLANISKGFDVQLAAGKLLPQPSSPMVTLTASWTVIGYQWCAWLGVLSILGMSDAHDPLNGVCYTYLTNASQNRYQVLSLQEGSSVTAMELPFVDTAYAGPYDTRTPSTRGSSLGILLGTGANLNQPVQEYASFTGLDISSTNTQYSAYFPNGVVISGTGSKLVMLKSSLTTSSTASAYDASLVGYWDMETTVGNGILADLSGNGNTGSGIASTSFGWISWKVGKATEFLSACNKGAVVKDTTVLKNFTSGMTLSAWIKPYNNSMHSYVLSKGNYTSGWNPHAYALKFIGTSWGDDMQVLIPTATTTGLVIQQVDYATFDTWQLMTATYDKTNVKIYKNGTLVTTSPNTSAIFANNEDLRIWALTTGVGSQMECFNGVIDEVRIYNRALSDSEIQTLYNSAK